jgi:hypothetical protein
MPSNGRPLEEDEGGGESVKASDRGIIELRSYLPGRIKGNHNKYQ